MNIVKIRKSYNRQQVPVIDWLDNVWFISIYFYWLLSSSPVFFLKSLDQSPAPFDSLIQKVHVSKPICMHYSNTGLKIAFLFLPRSYLCSPPISLQVRRSLTLTQCLSLIYIYIYTHTYIHTYTHIHTGNRVNGWSLYLLWKAIMLCLSQELESSSQMSREATWDRKYGVRFWDSFLSVLFILIYFY